MKKEIIIGVFVGLILGLVIGFFIFSPKTPIENLKLKICPDAWYDDQMPTIIGSNNPPSQYFIIDGERRELSEFDVDWIKENCEVNEPTVVQ
ncbi:MAG: hypothetical protein WDZ77_02340 [Candidatus Pacearchaeota archaeon]